MKNFLDILILGLLWCNFALALSLPKDVASGNTYKKSKGLKKCKETRNTGCFVHYVGLKPKY